MTEPSGTSSFGDPGTPVGGGQDFQRTSNVNLTANSSQYQQEMGAAAKATQQTGEAVGGLMTKVDNLFKLAGRTLKIGGAAGAASLGGGVASLGRLESQMASLQATSAVTGKSYGDFTKSVDTSFGKFSNSRQEIVGLVAQLGSLSVKTRDISSITQTMVRLGAATNESIPQLTQGVVELGRSFGQVDAKNIEKSSNTLLTLSKNAGTSASSVVQFAQAIAPLSRQAGLMQKDVLGIATAFSKVGADGVAGGNAFNSMINDINVSIRTGSPDIAKYSTLIGKSAEQFKRLPAKERVAAIFDALGKGDSRALNFVQEQGYGTRALAAFTGVAQGGGIRRQMNIADNANPKNLQRGSDAAMGGLNDSVGRIRNQIVRFGDMLAKPLLAPVTGLAKGFAWMLSGVNGVVKALGPLPGIVASLATVLMPLVGFLLSHAGLVAGGALVRTMFGRESAGRQAFSAGRADAAPTGDRYRDRIGYRAGQFAAGRAGGAPGLLRSGVGYGLGVAQAGRRFMYDTQSRFLRESMMTQAQRRESVANRPTMRQAWGNFRTESAARAEMGIARSVTQQGTRFVGSIFRLGVDTARAGTAMTKASLGLAASASAVGAARGAGGALGLAGRLGGVAGRAGSGLLTGARALGSAAFSLPGFLAMTAGTAIIGKINDSTSKQAKNANLGNDVVNPISKYNELLGTTTTNLANFSSGLASATAGMPKGQAPATMKSALKVTDEDKASAPNKPVAKIFGRVKEGADKTLQPDALAAALGTMPITDPKQLQQAKLDMLASGIDPKIVQKALTTYQMAGGPNKISGTNLKAGGGPHTLQRMIARTEATGTVISGDPEPSKAGQQLLGSIVGGIDSTRISEAKTMGAPAAQQRALIQYAQALSPLLSTTKQGGYKGLATERALSGALSKITGGDKKKYQEYLTSHRDDINDTESGRQRFLVKALGQTDQGKRYLKGISGSGGNLDPIFADPNATALVKRNNREVGALGRGPLSDFIRGNRAVNAALTNRTNDPGTQQAATKQLSDKAIQTAGSMTKADKALTDLAANLGGASNATGKLLEAAAAWTRQLQDLDLPNMSRGQQTDVLRTRASDSQGTVNRLRAAGREVPKEIQDKANSDKIAYAQQQNSNIQYMNGIYQQVKAFGTQRVRAEEDYNTQVFRSQQSFQIQMQQSEEDYLRSRGRQIKDFNIQQARQANAAAKSIYNPFERVQSQSVVNGGILVDNLQDQNQRIERQRSQLAALRKAGLSQASIDTLGLADPNNAQQTNSIARDVINDPRTIKEINKQVLIRKKSTAQLTQSVVNEDFRNTMADFQKGLARGAKDYRTAHTRAVDAQKLALANMSTDYRTMVRRTGEDLTTSMTELYGNFSKTYARTLREINKSIGDAIPDLKKTLDGALGGLGGSGGGASAPVGSKANPSYAAGRTGLNEKNVLGHYDKGGHFIKATANEARGYGEAGKKNYIANPKTAPQDKVYGWLYQAGWPRNSEKTHIMRAIVHAESGDNPNSHNPNPPDNSYGLAQINMLGSLGPARRRQYGLKSNEDLYNPVTNLKIAKRMSGSGSNFTPWTTYTRGAYRQYMAAGGIVMSPQMDMHGVTRGEAGAEATVPLESARGARFMTGMYDQISLAIASRVRHQAPGNIGTGSTSSTDNRQWHEDRSTHFDGPITVMADDPNAMQRELEKRVRTKRLTQPASSAH